MPVVSGFIEKIRFSGAERGASQRHREACAGISPTLGVSTEYSGRASATHGGLIEILTMDS